MAEGSRGLGHLVTPADWFARISHDPQHICERQLAGCGCFLPHLLVGAAGRSLGTAGARPLSTVSVHRAIAVDRKPRAVRSISGSLVPQYGTASTIQRGAVRAKRTCLFFCPRARFISQKSWLIFFPPPPQITSIESITCSLEYLILNHVKTTEYLDAAIGQDTEGRHVKPHATRNEMTGGQ